ncbi:phage coat protein [Marinomonas piezotolerans]|uniref:Phage coat protein n=1 Tax=Marinomonas piezotolerans TaxID=2213058 RepID=A0A370U4T8_9GAMM|nr:major coat protein [Marinomonas piezotolerans]RDL42758.1 phage coat protein [Marinomonas piezotolerans]
MKMNNLATKVTATTAVLLTSVTTARAALPADAQAAVDSVNTFATDMIAWAWPVVATITVAGIGIKLFKKFSNKAT